MAKSKNIVIIGSGMAGYTLLREIRKLDSESEISVICADNGDFYSKPMQELYPYYGESDA